MHIDEYECTHTMAAVCRPYYIISVYERVRMCQCVGARAGACVHVCVCVRASVCCAHVCRPTCVRVHTSVLACEWECILISRVFNCLDFNILSTTRDPVIPGNATHVHKE